jgi:hypothetical protein
VTPTSPRSSPNTSPSSTRKPYSACGTSSA